MTLASEWPTDRLGPRVEVESHIREYSPTADFDDRLRLRIDILSAESPGRDLLSAPPIVGASLISWHGGYVAAN